MTTTIDPAVAEELYDALEYEHGTESVGDVTIGGWKLIASSETDSGRWHSRYFLVVADEDGVTWGLRYGIGLTEYQEHDLPWKEFTGPLPLVRLYPHEVTTTRWRPTPPKGADTTSDG